LSAEDKNKSNIDTPKVTATSELSPKKRNITLDTIKGKKLR